MVPSKPLMYAELLSNIRQISVIVALEEPCDPATKVELSADGRRFIFHRAEEASSLSLPGQVPPSLQLQKPALGSTELTWRLPLASQPTHTSMDNMQSNDAPWSAKWLGQETEFLCRDCGAIIVRKGSITTWRDLPSENWAEMMDFWHCHKPDVPKTSGSSGHDGQVGVENSISNRGYGANTKFTPTPGVGFVDLTTFLLMDADCTNILTEPSSDETPKYHRISCQACHHYVGHHDHHAAGIRLYKWRLRSTPTSQMPSKSTSLLSSTLPSLPAIIGAQLAASMRSQGLSRFVILPTQWMPTSQESTQPRHDLSPLSDGLLCVTPTCSPTLSSTSMKSDDKCSMADDTPGSGPLPGSSHSTFLSLWILTPSLKFSRNAAQMNSESATFSRGTATEPDSGTSAMKVFWRIVTAEAAEALMESTGVDEVLLPADAIWEIEACLRSSSLYLPPSARRFQNWDVGLLERYEE